MEIYITYSTTRALKSWKRDVHQFGGIYRSYKRKNGHQYCAYIGTENGEIIGEFLVENRHTTSTAGSGFIKMSKEQKLKLEKKKYPTLLDNR